MNDEQPTFVLLSIFDARYITPVVSTLAGTRKPLKQSPIAYKKMATIIIDASDSVKSWFSPINTSFIPNVILLYMKDIENLYGIGIYIIVEREKAEFQRRVK